MLRMLGFLFLYESVIRTQEDINMKNNSCNLTKIFFLILFVGISFCLAARPSQKDSCTQFETTHITEWELSSILESTSQGITVVGQPKIVSCPFGKAVLFDGQGDAIVLDTNLLVNMRQFTIEVIMRPDTNGQREQRFLHFGEVRGERVMVETRLTKNDQWYLDTYMKSGSNSQTLVDSTKLHPLNQWHHVAFVVNDGQMQAYVNGSKELEGQIPFSPFTKGQTSVGVRLNKVNWYKGVIYKIKITPLKLEPALFMKIK
jgi:hypothetical protein